MNGKTVLLLGVSYRAGVEDTRFSPSKLFAEELIALGAHVLFHDPLVTYWRDFNQDVMSELPKMEDIDAIVFCVPHTQYRKINITEWVNNNTPFVLDSNNVLSKKQLQTFRRNGCQVFSIGRGEIK